MTRLLTPISAKEIASLEWLTIRECAAVLRVSIEHVRGLCVRYEHGHADGLRSVDVASDPDCGRRDRRVHREWLDEFMRAERRQARAQDRHVAAILSREVLDFDD